MRERDALFRNAVVASSWLERFDGKLVGWEEQIWTGDYLGRRVVRHTAGKFNESGDKEGTDTPVEVSSTFNGELTVVEQFDPNRDRLSGDNPDIEQGYRSAVVADAAAPARKSIENRRNPVEYLRTAVMPQLVEVEKSGRPVDVRETGEGLIELGYELSDGRVSVDVVLDPARGWAFKSWSSRDTSSGTVSTINVELGNSNGFWVAVSGQHLIFTDESKPPALDWRFSTSKVDINDDEFDESVFEPTFAADTAVSDARFGVAYRIGEESLKTPELAALASAARKELSEKTLLRSETPGNGRQTFLIVNAVMLAVFLLFTLGRRKKKVETVVFLVVLFSASSNGLCDERQTLPANPYIADGRRMCGPQCIGFLECFYRGGFDREFLEENCRPGDAGTSLSQLGECLSKLNYSWKGFADAGTEDLATLNETAIVHLNTEKGDHFMVILGYSDSTDTFLGFSPPRDQREFSRSEIEQTFSGRGIVVSTDEIKSVRSAFGRRSVLVATLSNPVIGTVLALSCIILVMWSRRKMVAPDPPAGHGLAVVFGTAFLIGCSPGEIRVSDSNNNSHFFGDVLPGAAVEHRFTIPNNTSGPLRIIGVDKSCSCQEVAVSSFEAIAPGSSCSIAIKIDTHGKEGPVKEQVVVRTDSDDTSLAAFPLTLTAYVSPEVKAVPSQLMFGELEGIGPWTRQFHVRLVSERTLDEVPFVSVHGNPFLTVRLSDSSPGLLTYEAVVDSTIPAGTVGGTITLAFGESDGSALELPIHGKRTSTIRVLPKSLVFDRGDTRKVLRITRVDQEACTVTEILCPDGYSAEELSSVDDGAVEIAITANLTAASNIATSLLKLRTKEGFVGVPLMLVP
ncbi:MAG: DUF1573 domain-containing protein [Planctomycetota bacterium]